ncbi:MAG TPA: VWA domain-containing protein [Terriglobales bacterium]|nr:VWA domain-containing protein [Terriglobales bacterium]HUL15442.1 VWA domain-containing protein [Terriglobales bacterium]
MSSSRALFERAAPAALLVLLTALRAVPQGLPQDAPEQTSPPLRVSVDRVNIGVIVTNSKGDFIENLGRDQFEIFDDGVPQPLTAFLSVDDPAQIVLMLECGPAVYFFRDDLIRAADTLLTRLAPADRVAIVCYDSSPDLRLDFTPNKDEARLALRDLNFMMGFGEVNLTSSLFSVLHWLQAVPGKKTIVLVTSGVDSSPPKDPTTLRQKLDASDVRILAVSTAEQMQKPPHQGRFWRSKVPPEQVKARAEVKQVLSQASGSLREISEITGGRVYTPKTSKDFDRAYGEIAEFVRHEYDLEFSPPVHDGKLHTIEVRVKHHSYQLIHREAYLAPQPSS